MTCNVEGCTVSPRKSRKKSACFSSTSVSTPARPRRYPSIIPAGPPPTMQHRVVITRPDGRSEEVPASMIWLLCSAPETLDLRYTAVAVGQLDRHEFRRSRRPHSGTYSTRLPTIISETPKSVLREGDDAKTLSFFNASRTCSIDFGQFAPMFRVDAARYRNAIS